MMKTRILAPWHWFWRPFDLTRSSYHCYWHGLRARGNRMMFLSLLSIAVLTPLPTVIFPHGLWNTVALVVFALGGFVPVIIAMWRGLFGFFPCDPPRCTCAVANKKASVGG